MSSFRVPAFLRPRHSFHRLRSFHLSPNSAQPIEVQLAHAQEEPIPVKKAKDLSVSLRRASVSHRLPKMLAPRSGIIPFSTKTYLYLAALLSFLFIMSISLTFAGAQHEEPFFKPLLDQAGISTPGLVLLGESIDVDVDEPSVTIRWSILACGDNFTLPGSVGSHGSQACGLPAVPLHIFVDADDEPTATYDPSQIPFNRDSGARRSIQNLVQFDSDHVLDVHSARLYPFDKYYLSATLRAVSFDNQTLPIQHIATVDLMSSFGIKTVDIESYASTNSSSEQSTRDIDMFIKRPPEARAFALLLFAISWVLTHVTVGHVIIARMTGSPRHIVKHLISTGAILIAIPQLRNSMPDAPGLDGVLIDCIGFFPQMLIASAAAIILLLILVVREFDVAGARPPPPPRNVLGAASTGPRPPPIPHEHSTSMEVLQYNRHRLEKHLTGQFVFPPVQPAPSAGGCRLRRHTEGTKEESIAYCRDLIRKHDYESFLISQFWPKGPLQEGFLALTAFSVELASVQESVSNVVIGQMRMQFWRDALKNIDNDSPPRHPIALALFDTCKTFRIQSYHLKRIIDARDAELNNPSFLTTESLTEHAESTSSTMLYALLSLLPHQPALAADFSHAASHLGVARTISTLIRALPFHASKGRMVIPAEITSKHGVIDENVFRYGGDAQGIRDAVYEFAVVANDHLITARSVFEKNHGGKVPRDAMPVFLIGAPVSVFLSGLEKAEFDAFAGRLQTRDWKLAWKVWRTFQQEMF
ncbi:hypothetical protein HGRIS_006127 [Hohenbuehelia grisea]|uniref:Uncharacterized protein n=1 Tax=Hohenbuehelia grisea TaxID=104357 RepID=A0ABR3K0I3_9AGAR